MNEKRRLYRQRPDIKEKRNILAKEWNKKNLPSVLLTHARKRARLIGVECSLTKDDIVIPDICPVLGIPLAYSDGKVSSNSPSIDRFDSLKGYHKDNIHVISHRANRLKSNGTIDEFLSIIKWMEKVNG